MKSKTIVVAIAVAIVIASLSAYVIVQKSDDYGGYQYPEINEGLFETRSFDVVDKDTGSWIKGKIFFISDGEDTLIRVFADIHIASGDFGGANISSGSNKIRPTEIYTDYGEYFGSEYVWISSDMGWVSIGSEVRGQPPFGGLDGSAIIDFVPTESFNPETEPLSITLAVGSKILEDGTLATCTTHETVNVFLNQPMDDTPHDDSPTNMNQSLYHTSAINPRFVHSTSIKDGRPIT